MRILGVAILIMIFAPLVRGGDGTIELANLQSRFQAMAGRVAPSVVAVSACGAAGDADDAVHPDYINTEQLETLLSQVTHTVGAGMVIDADGYILTSEHVGGGAEQLFVTTDQRRVYPAIVVGSDPRADLAVLKVPAHDLTPVKFAPPGTLQRGMWTIALGNPYGLAAAGEMSMSVGIVSATDRTMAKLSRQEHRYYPRLIQTTAEINPGNSGGPLFNLDGQVIGISAAVILPQRSANGIGFAIPITEPVLQKIQDLKHGHETVYAYLGVMVSTPTVYQRGVAKVGAAGGVIIDTVEAGSPAAAYLTPGDVVLAAAGQAVRDSEHFIEIVGAGSVNEPTRFSVRRGGEPLELDIALRRRELPSVAVHGANQHMRWNGAAVSNAAGGVRVLQIDEQSPLLRQGIAVGSVITAVGGRRVSTIVDLMEIAHQTPPQQAAVVRVE